MPVVLQLIDAHKRYGSQSLLDGASCALADDQKVGLIGRNGAGKSTLMRLLSAVDLPDSGKIITKGRLSWPVGLKGGLQKTLSGRDNVKFVCRIHGVRKAGMLEKVRYVQAFADIGRYFDEPVSTYSSGMVARLAFGTSMAFDFDYYLIDEVMAVGDVTFRRKSSEVFDERLQRANVIIVSHNMGLIKKMCNFVVYLDSGRATLYEDVDNGIAAYQSGGGEP
jgi:capsular polysaccharide transport system ATP-binding protein